MANLLLQCARQKKLCAAIIDIDALHNCPMPKQNSQPKDNTMPINLPTFFCKIAYEPHNLQTTTTNNNSALNVCSDLYMLSTAEFRTLVSSSNHKDTLLMTLVKKLSENIILT